MFNHNSVAHATCALQHFGDMKGKWWTSKKCWCALLGTSRLFCAERRDTGPSSGHIKNFSYALQVVKRYQQSLLQQVFLKRFSGSRHRNKSSAVKQWCSEASTYCFGQCLKLMFSACAYQSCEANGAPPPFFFAPSSFLIPWCITDVVVLCHW